MTAVADEARAAALGEAAGVKATADWMERKAASEIQRIMRMLPLVMEIVEVDFRTEDIVPQNRRIVESKEEKEEARTIKILFGKEALISSILDIMDMILMECFIRQH